MTRRTRIKICGVRDVDTALAAAEAGADAIGLMFVPTSPRVIDADTARAISNALPPWVAPVAVFANQHRDVVLAWPGPWVQLHGNETETDAHLPRSVIRALPFDEATLRRWDASPNIAALLVDGPAGGSGTSFDHGALQSLMPELTRPIILAGGLTHDNVGAAIRTLRPYAVDVSSGVESARGVKDVARIHAFCDAVRAADA